MVNFFVCGSFLSLRQKKNKNPKKELVDVCGAGMIAVLFYAGCEGSHDLSAATHSSSPDAFGARFFFIISKNTGTVLLAASAAHCAIDPRFTL